jgi:hypothetical protein
MSMDECGNGGKSPDAVKQLGTLLSLSRTAIEANKPKIEIWWKINRYGCEIEPVQVVARTKCFLTLRPWKSELWTDLWRVRNDEEYFPTFNDARTAKLNQLHNTVMRLREEADSTHYKWVEVFKLEEPTVPQE